MEEHDGTIGLEMTCKAVDFQFSVEEFSRSEDTDIFNLPCMQGLRNMDRHCHLTIHFNRTCRYHGQ